MTTYHKKWILVLPIVAMMLSLTPLTQADVPENSLDLRDLEISVYVRRALMQDPDIARLNLGVSVQYNRATISGQVPSREVAERVRQIVENVKGVYQVKDTLRVVADEKEKEKAEQAMRDFAAGIEGNIFREDLFGTMDVPTPGGPQLVTTAHPDPKAWEQPASPVVVLLPPVPIAPAVVKTPAITLSRPREEESIDLATVIERLRFSEERYHEVRVEVSAGRVTLSGKVANMEHLIELGRALSQLPGVRHVDLRGVQVGR